MRVKIALQIIFLKQHNFLLNHVTVILQYVLLHTVGVAFFNFITMFQTIQRHVVCIAAYGTVHYKEPLKSK